MKSTFSYTQDKLTLEKKDASNFLTIFNNFTPIDTQTMCQLENEVLVQADVNLTPAKVMDLSINTMQGGFFL